ncbi:alpha/beta fold hydrolase [Sorangium sp. So ce1182]|uniref:alpha/beta fold hydrolase n=1 Tax=Sorangium sp. So ce1182 TaxID=3133334 RepID=UPI003F63E871
MLLLSGGGGWRLNFRAMIPVLAMRHTVYALDPPGQGFTEVRDAAFSYDADAVARSIGAFLDAVGLPRTAIVGHSWGGGFALRFAERHPDRVSRLALIAPGGLDVKDAWEFRLLRYPLLGELAVRLMFKRSVRHMLRKSFVHRERIPEALVEEAAHAARSPHLRAAMLRIERSVTWAETERDLPLVRAPVLLLWGSQDRYFPVHLIDRFTAQLPAVEAHIVPGCGHSLHDDCPQATYSLLSPFLERECDAVSDCSPRVA